MTNGGHQIGTPTLPYISRVDYLESTGMQYIDTGLKICPDTAVVDIEFSRTETSGGWGGFAGFYQTHGDFQFYYLLREYRDSPRRVSALLTDSTTAYYNFTFDNYDNGTFLKFHGENKSLVFSSTDRLISKNIRLYDDRSLLNFYLFAYNMNGSAQKLTKIRCRSLKITDSEGSIDMFPVRFLNENGVSEGAMYDQVSGRFFRNNGTGSFIIGPDKITEVNHG